MKEKLLCLVLIIVLVASNTFWLWRSTVPQAELEKVTVRFAYQHGFHYGQQIIMDYFDLVEKWTSGNAIATYQIIKGGTAQNEAFIANSLEFGSMGPAPAVKAVAQGVGTKIFASMGQKQSMIWTWRDDINSLADVKSGDKVNVQALNGVHHVSFIKAFSDLGKTIEDANEVAVFYSHPDAYQLMEQREIDVVFASAPYNAMYEEAGYKCIGDDATIWGTPLPGSVLVGRVNFCEDHPDMAAAVYMAWLEATHWINNNPEKASEVIGEVYGYDQSKVWQQWQDAHLLFNPTFGLSALEDYATVMYELEIIDSQLSEKNILYNHTQGVIGH